MVPALVEGRLHNLPLRRSSCQWVHRPSRSGGRDLRAIRTSGCGWRQSCVPARATPRPSSMRRRKRVEVALVGHACAEAKPIVRVAHHAEVGNAAGAESGRLVISGPNPSSPKTTLGCSSSTPLGVGPTWCRRRWQCWPKARESPTH